ncbi:MAG: hypothetical protein HQL44_03205 [Alphaproteobacteria bacterium]|nr:hypothetical protein [Alphaproteobacteria bacterium]
MVVPECLSLTDNYEETCELLTALPNLVFKEKMKVFLHFSKLRVLEPMATLLLTGEIYRCHHVLQDFRFKGINGNYPTDPNTFKQLDDFGFYSLLNIPSPPPAATGSGSTHFIRYFSHNKVLAEKASILLGSIISKAFDVEEASQRYLGSALVEAMNNTVEHAYKKRPSLPVMPKRWWFGGAVDSVNKEFNILLHDQGIGIPETIEPSLLQQARILMGSVFSGKDGAKIALATKLGESSTKQPGRGKGFETMKKAVRSCDDGELTVLSNSGIYRYNSQGIETHDDHTISINGTILQWRVRHASSMMRLEA